MAEKYLVDEFNDGSVRIADDVLGTIASVAAESVDGVVDMQSNFKASVTDMLGVKNLSRGVKVTVGEHEAVIDMFLTVLYGRNIIDICKEVQVKVKEAIENMTGLDVVEVNTHVSGIALNESTKVKA